jgi:hypothetical protein
VRQSFQSQSALAPRERPNPGFCLLMSEV